MTQSRTLYDMHIAHTCLILLMLLRDYMSPVGVAVIQCSSLRRCMGIKIYCNITITLHGSYYTIQSTACDFILIKTTWMAVCGSNRKSVLRWNMYRYALSRIQQVYTILWECASVCMSVRSSLLYNVLGDASHIILSFVIAEILAKFLTAVGLFT